MYYSLKYSTESFEFNFANYQVFLRKGWAVSLTKNESEQSAEMSSHGN